MATVEVEPVPAPALPDYLTDPNAVLKDASAWRYGKAPDYSKTRTVFEKTKKQSHEASSLPSLVENLVKNWEIEASFKPQLSDWRTIDYPNYSFAINGGTPQTAEHMLKVGTYNAIIAPNEFYSPANSDFASSHKTFKRMMPTFAWEVVEVYSGPPHVAFRWRHWGEMKNDYVGFNDKGEKITAKAHNGTIDIEGVTVALVDDQVRLQKVETWFDPLEMFRQIAPNGIVNKEVHDRSHLNEADDEGAPDVALNAKSEGDVPEVSKQAEELIKTPQTEKTDKNEPSKGNKSRAPSNAELSEPVVANVPQAHNDREHEQTQSSIVPAAPVTSTQTNDDSTAQLAQNEEASTRKTDGGPQPGAPSEPKFNENTSVAAPLASEFGKDLEGSQAPEPKQEDIPSTSNNQFSILPQSLPDHPHPGSQDPLHQILAALQSVQSDYRHVSAAIDRFGERIRSLEGGNASEATAVPGSAVAAAPESEETRRAHEEMGRVFASECPFLMNQE